MMEAQRKMQDKKQALLSMQSPMALMSGLLGYPSKIHELEKQSVLHLYAQEDMFEQKAVGLLGSLLYIFSFLQILSRCFRYDQHGVLFGLAYIFKPTLVWVINLAIALSLGLNANVEVFITIDVVDQHYSIMHFICRSSSCLGSITILEALQNRTWITT